MRHYRGAPGLPPDELAAFARELTPLLAKVPGVNPMHIGAVFNAWHEEVEAKHHDRPQHEEVLVTILEEAALLDRVAARFRWQGLSAAFHEHYGKSAEEAAARAKSALGPVRLAELREIWERHRGVASSWGVAAAVVMPP
jgi:hypothetical protein